VGAGAPPARFGSSQKFFRLIPRKICFYVVFGTAPAKTAQVAAFGAVPNAPYLNPKDKH
jgi:hypothetical protein